MLDDKGKFTDHVVISLDTYNRMQSKISDLTKQKNDYENFVDDIINNCFAINGNDVTIANKETIVSMFTQKFSDKIDAWHKKQLRSQAAVRRAATMKKRKEQKEK